jgi:hypothetical protein
VEWLKCLPSKNEALSSNPNTSNSKKKKVYEAQQKYFKPSPRFLSRNITPG